MKEITLPSNETSDHHRQTNNLTASSVQQAIPQSLLELLSMTFHQLPLDESAPNAPARLRLGTASKISGQ